MTDAPSSQPRLAPGGEEEGRPAAAVVWLLYLLAIPSANLLAVVGVVVAYVARGSATGWVRTHFDQQIMLFWSTIVWFIVLSVLIFLSAVASVIVIGIPFLLLFAAAMLLLFVWFTVKSVFGLINVIQKRPAT